MPSDPTNQYDRAVPDPASARPAPPPLKAGGSAVLWAVAAAVFLGGLGLFVVRGLLPGLGYASDDFQIIYPAARGWLHGVNPYDAAALDPLWTAADGPDDHRPSIRGSDDLLYPPPTFPLVAPVAALDWPVAKAVWAMVNLAAVGASIAAAMSIIGARRGRPATWIFMGAALAFAPWITGIKMGQTAVLLVALVVGGHALRLRGWPIAAGIAFGLAAALKPQVGLVFVAYEVFRGRWRVAVPAMLAGALVAAIGITRLVYDGIPWVESLSANVHAFTTGTGAGNPLPENVHRYQMIDFRPIIQTFTENRAVGAIGAWGVAGLLGLFALPAWLRRQEDGRELLALSIGAAASLLIVYHRFYDAAILLIPLAWVFWSFTSVEGRRFGWTRWAVLLGLLPFFVPGAAALYTLERSGRLPASLTGSVVWEILVLHHQAWALVWLTGALGLALRRCPRRTEPAFAWLARRASE